MLIAKMNSVQKKILWFKNGVQRRVMPRRAASYLRHKSFFRGKTGLEIGGPSQIIFGRYSGLPVYRHAKRIDNCNFSGATVWEGTIQSGRTFVFSRLKKPGMQYIAEAADLSGIADETYDFVLSSHCIEHLANPLKGLAEWSRVLKKNGLLVLIVPNKEFSFDHRRPVTRMGHLIEDFRANTGEGDTTHFEEIFALHDISMDPGAKNTEFLKERTAKNLENRCVHHHVFDLPLVGELVSHAGLSVLSAEVFDRYQLIVIAEKT